MDEFPTGGIKRGETATEDETLESAARREAEEETGCIVTDMICYKRNVLESAGRMGATNNFVFARFSAAKAMATINRVHGAEGEDEFIRTRLVRPSELQKFVDHPDSVLNLGSLAMASEFLKRRRQIRDLWLNSEKKLQMPTMHSLLPVFRERRRQAILQAA